MEMHTTYVLLFHSFNLENAPDAILSKTDQVNRSQALAIDGYMREIVVTR